MTRLTLILVLLAAAAVAVEPTERLADPVLEARARDVSKALRCVVCQNETIDESNAELAKDMRLLVRDRIVAGDSNQAVLDYMVERYGDFVLLKPRFTATNLALWAAPFALLGLGLVVARRTLRRPTGSQPQGLNAEETKRVQQLMDGSP